LEAEKPAADGVEQVASVARRGNAWRPPRSPSPMVSTAMWWGIVSVSVLGPTLAFSVLP
jgi:hypothetical protein